MSAVDVLRREITFSPAFDKRDPDPCKNYGIHGCDLRMHLIGERGAVQFVLYTDWHLPHVDRELRAKGSKLSPTPADLGYHSFIPLYEGQCEQAKCNVLGCKCFYDGSGLNAEPIYEILLREGSEGVWTALESYYDETLPTLEAIHAFKSGQGADA